MPVITTDTQGRLHNEYGRAVEWQSGEGYFFLHGVRFEQELYAKVVGQAMDFQEVMALVDIDQRWVAMKFMDSNKLLKGANGQLLNESTRGNELWLIEGLFPNQPKAYFLRYLCPSTGRVYLSGIEPSVGQKGSADECMAWKHGYSVEDYQQLEVEA